MALSRKKKIIIGVSALIVLSLIIIISVIATRRDEAEVTTVKVEMRPELKLSSVGVAKNQIARDLLPDVLIKSDLV